MTSMAVSLVAQSRPGSAFVALLTLLLPVAVACGSGESEEAAVDQAATDQATTTLPPEPTSSSEPASGDTGSTTLSPDSATQGGEGGEGGGQGGGEPAGSTIDGATDPYSGELVPEIIATYPHDTDAFTQGLEWYGDQLLESTGLLGESSLRLVDPQSGQAEVLTDVADELFAEGVTVVDGQALQLTWQNETLLVSDLERLGSEGAVTRTDQAYDGEGWGLCYDGSALVMSDGSSELEFRDPATFEVLRTVEVTLDGSPITQLNELECVGSQVWANVWQTEQIVAINAESGVVEATVDASSLTPEDVVDGNDVLNGIAHHDETGRFWLTGKRWPVLYEVALVPASG